MKKKYRRYLNKQRVICLDIPDESYISHEWNGIA
jgi:predicted protein tyrosine phosphatase